MVFLVLFSHMAVAVLNILASEWIRRWIEEDQA